MLAGVTPPASVAQSRKGTETATKARPVIHAARNFASRISAVVASVTCTGARVAASRSPLIALPLRVGETRHREQQHEEHDDREDSAAAVGPESERGERKQGHGEQHREEDAEQDVPCDAADALGQLEADEGADALRAHAPVLRPLGRAPSWSLGGETCGSRQRAQSRKRVLEHCTVAGSELTTATPAVTKRPQRRDGFALGRERDEHRR